MGSRDSLRIACRHRQSCWQHLEQLTIARLSRSPAVFAHVERDLVARLSVIGRTPSTWRTSWSSTASSSKWAAASLSSLAPAARYQ